MHTGEVASIALDFQHSGEIWRDFPELVPGIMFADGITPDVAAGDRVARFTDIARSRLAGTAESELPEIRAWRHAFTRMGLKPTQYRCASEALLRRLRKEESLPPLHPLVDICNAASAAFAIPVAVFDASKIAGRLEVRYAAGDEDYLTFSGQTEHPGPHEVIFADEARQVHARRWTNRQSGLSAVQAPTAAALIVAEAMHESAASDVPRLIAAIGAELNALWSIAPVATVLSQSAPRFRYG
jgi:DNA/RNA-binding domain of Phe-tRNA-synthetase-like protein